MTTVTAPAIPIIDIDSHVTEPPDLWINRMPKRWADLTPRVTTDETGAEA